MLVAASVLWSSGGVLIKWVDWHPLAIAGTRSFVSALVFIVYLRKPRFTWSLSQLGAALCYTATVMLFVSAVKLTTSANAIALQYTAPIYTALFGGLFLKEPVRWFDWLAVVAVLGGVFLFFFDKLSLRGYTGNLVAVVSGISMAGIGVFLRGQKGKSNLESILLGNVLTALFCSPVIFSSAPPGLKGWVGLVLLGVFQLGFSYIFFATALKRVRALDAILICAIEPVLNPIWVFLLIGERPGRWALLGGCVILVSVAARSVAEFRTRFSP